jgi:hypothetical protein
MLWNASALRGFTVEATDGQIGTVSDILFDDQSWKLRWLVVHTGTWLFGRKVLLPLSALGKPDETDRKFNVLITKKQVQDSPDVAADLPVSRHLEAHVYNYYDWNPYWRSGFSSMANAVGTPVYMPRTDDVGPRSQDGGTDAVPDDGDEHLRSVMAVIGYHMEALDGAIGHAEDFIVDDSDWYVHYITVDTKNWLPGQRVVISPELIREIDWISRSVFLKANRKKIEDSPPYDPNMTQDGGFNDQFKKYFGLSMMDHDDREHLKIGR